MDDLKYKYTMDQVYLFYEKCKKVEMDSQKMDAIISANSMILATPSYDKSDGRKKHRAWEKFIDGLTWETLEKKSKGVTMGDFLGMFRQAGIPIKGSEK